MRGLLVIALFFACEISFAANTVLTFGADFGGETLATIQYSDGSTSSLKTGNGLSAAVGGIWGLNELWTLQATVGLKYATTQEASNQSADFSRTVLEAIGFYNFPDQNMRAGGGLAYHMSPKVDASGAVLNGSINFDSALGYLVEWDYVQKGNSPALLAGLRYTLMKYSANGSSVGADSFGFQLGWIF